MPHGNFGQNPVKSRTTICRLGAVALVFVDDLDALFWPPQSDRVVDQTVLPLARLSMLQYLLGIRLPDINKGQAVQMPVTNLGRPKGRQVPRVLERTQDMPREGKLRWSHDCSCATSSFRLSLLNC